MFICLLPTAYCLLPTAYCHLIPKRLAGFQRVLNALERLRLADEAEERFALEIEQLLLGHRRRMRQRSARHDRRQLPADERVVIADAARSPREVNPELQRREDAVAADGDRHA